MEFKMLFPASLAAMVLITIQQAAAWDAQVGADTNYNYTTSDGGASKNPMPLTFVTNSDGSKSVSGSASIGSYALDPLGVDHVAAVSGMAASGPGFLKCFVHGLALNFSHDPNVPPLPNALGVQANFGAVFTEYMMVSNSSPALTNGAPVRFHVTVHSRGGSTGTYRVGGEYDTTGYHPGSYLLTVYAGLNAGTTYGFPNGLFQQVPDNLNFDIPLDVDAHVGDNVLIYYSLGVGVEDRTGGPWYNGASYQNQESIVDVSHTISLNIDPTTPGVALFSDSGYDYASRKPRIDVAVLAGPNLVITGSQGVTNGTYYVYTSTSMALPLTSWIYQASKVFDAEGNFAFTNSIIPGEPQRFYFIRLP